MKFFKLITMIMLLGLNACGGKSPAPSMPETPSLPDSPEKLYFEKQCLANCAIHATNMAFGAKFTTSRKYDDYINFESMPKTGFITDEQVQVLRDYYASLSDEEYYDPNKDLTQLTRDFNASGFMPLDDYIDNTGILNHVKPIGNVLLMLNEQYELGLSDDKIQSFPTVRALLDQNPPELVNAERLIIDTGGHFVALYKLPDGRWFFMDSGNADAGPQKIEGDHIDWLREQEQQKPNQMHAQYFTSADLTVINEKALELRQP